MRFLSYVSAVNANATALRVPCQSMARVWSRRLPRDDIPPFSAMYPPVKLYQVRARFSRVHPELRQRCRISFYKRGNFLDCQGTRPAAAEKVRLSGMYSGDTAGILLTRHYTDNTEDSKVPAADLLAQLHRHLPLYRTAFGMQSPLKPTVQVYWCGYQSRTGIGRKPSGSGRLLPRAVRWAARGQAFPLHAHYDEVY